MRKSHSGTNNAAFLLYFPWITANYLDFLVEKLKSFCPTNTKEDESMKASESPGAGSATSISSVDMSLVEAVDTLVMLYFFGVHRQFSKVKAMLHCNLRRNSGVD